MGKTHSTIYEKPLQPHPNLQILKIEDYACSKFPDWVTSPLNRLREIWLRGLPFSTSIPPLWKLPCLEQIHLLSIPKLQFLGRDFLGITTASDQSSSSSSSGSATDIGFPKLEELEFVNCSNWEEWEDITLEEESDGALKFMPCLTTLTINDCNSLTALPHRLLRKASSLEVLTIRGCSPVFDAYRDKDGAAWKSISGHNPRLQFGFSIQ